MTKLTIVVVGAAAINAVERAGPIPSSTEGEVLARPSSRAVKAGATAHAPATVMTATSR